MRRRAAGPRIGPDLRPPGRARARVVCVAPGRRLGVRCAAMSESALRTGDIPQAENLEEVREVVTAVQIVGTATEDLAEYTGFSDRHVCYRLHAAEVLGWLTKKRRITSLGDRLLATSPGSREEHEALRVSVGKCRVIKLVVPDLLTSPELDHMTVADKLRQLAGLSASTAERRARVLVAWHRQLMGDESAPEE